MDWFVGVFLQTMAIIVGVVIVTQIIGLFAGKTDETDYDFTNAKDYDE